jgi:hypothetical protein
MFKRIFLLYRLLPHGLFVFIFCTVTLASSAAETAAPASKPDPKRVAVADPNVVLTLLDDMLNSYVRAAPTKGPAKFGLMGLNLASLTQADIKALVQAPAQPASSTIDMAAYNLVERGTGEIGYATLRQLEAFSDPGLQEAEKRFLPSCRRVMAAADTMPGSQFAPSLSAAFKEDVQSFQDNLEAYLDSKGSVSNPGLRMAVAFVRIGYPSGKRDAVEEAARLAAIGVTTGEGGAPPTLRQNLANPERTVFALGLIAEVWRYERAHDAVNGLTHDLTHTQLPDLAAKLMTDCGIEAAADCIGAVNNVLLSIDALRSALDKAHPLDQQSLPSVRAAFAGFGDALRALGVALKAKEGDLQQLGRLTETIDACLDAYGAYLAKSYPLCLTHLTAAAIQLDDFAHDANGSSLGAVPFMKWANVAAALGQVKKQKDFDQIVDSLSGPVSSYRTYRGQGSTYISFKGYLGVAGGPEALPGDGKASYGALFAPIGLEWGYSLGNKLMTYVGLLAAPVDLGAVTATRFSSAKDTSKSPTLQDVLAPGAYLTLGLSKNWPITLGIGRQFAFHGRQDPTTGQTVRADRTMVFLAIDIPYVSRLF